MFVFARLVDFNFRTTQSLTASLIWHHFRIRTTPLLASFSILRNFTLS